MDWLSRLLISIDAFKLQWINSNKHNADDYYQLVSPVSDFTIKMNDGSMASFYSLKGFSSILTDAERRSVSKRIHNSLKGYFNTRGYSLQIVDVSDPSLTKRRVAKSMHESFEELKNIGLDSPIFIEDYLDFVTGSTVWSDQFLVVKTSPLSVMGNGQDSPNLDSSVEAKETFIKNSLKSKVTDQAIFLSDVDQLVLSNHNAFSKIVQDAFENAGALISALDTNRALRGQKEALYGVSSSENWTPNTSSVFVKKKTQSKATDKAVVASGDLVDQVVDQGGKEVENSTSIFVFGGRYYSTLNMVIPQTRSDGLAGYQKIKSAIPADIGYMSSYRFESDPFSTSEYRTEQIFTTLGAILPFTNNHRIRDARNAIKDLHVAGDELSVFMQMTITFFHEDINQLKSNLLLAKGKLANWNGAQFRFIEQDITQGLFDTLPGATKQSNGTQVLESLTDALYQSPLFCDGVIYSAGYLHFLSENGRPYPYEDQSSLNINFNMYVCGTSGSGKSTLLSMLNLALMAKPKANPKLRGEMPVIFNVDFGKTSFGLVESIKMLVGKKKEHLFISHEMTTGIESAYNIHDLPFGRETPTMRQKAVIVRFIATLICEMEEKNGFFKLLYSEIQDMIKTLVDAVYDYRKEENSPRTFESAEFKHKDVIAYMESLGITPDRRHSYYWLASEVMRRSSSSGKGIKSAMLLRRYAYPRLGDYSEVMTARMELGDKFDKEKLGNGATFKSYFLRRVSQSIQEYPCFNRVTKINIDRARMISIDIKNVCGEDNQRKAIFGSMCLAMFMVKKENTEESPDLYEGVDELYLPFLKRLDASNTQLPGVLNIEEAHVLQALFEKVLIEIMRQNRKANWGLRSFSQNLTDPSDEFFSSCGTVLVTSNESRSGNIGRFNEMGLSDQEREIVKTELSDRISSFFAYIKTKSSGNETVPFIKSKLNSVFPPAFIWASQSDQTDRAFKKDVIDALGFDEGFKTLSSLFRKGNVKKYFENEYLKDLSVQKGFDSVHSMLIDHALRQGSRDETITRLL